jgi:hypothetical protein
MSENSRLFCSKPFSWFEVTDRNDGETFLCCPAWLERPIGNLSQSSVQEVWNSPVAADIRRSILDGTFEYCSRTRCPFLQTKSGPVQEVSTVTDPKMKRAIEEQLTVLPWGPLDVCACHDRSCNLSCPTCRSEVIMEHNRKDQILLVQSKLNDEALKEARLLYVTGTGDPFGSPYFRKWLQTMKRSDMPHLEQITLHTNALLWTPRMWQTIPQEIRALVRRADISVDAASAQTYAINRRGGDFDRLLENLEFVSSSLRANGPLEWIGLSMVVQQNNFHEMADFVRLAQRLKVDTVYFSQLVNWGTFTESEFNARAVHLPDHPDYPKLIDQMQDPIFDQPFVYLGNLSTIRRREHDTAA